MEWVLLTIFRLLVPLTLLRFPFIGAVLSILADGLDYPLLHLHTQNDFILYQQWDKLLDLYYLSIEATILLTWRNRWVRKTGFTLFVYRLIGVILYSLTHLRFLLFIFPNVFEMFYLFNVAYYAIKKYPCPFPTKKNLFLVVGFLTVPKLIQEYFIHVYQRVPWQIITFDQVLGGLHVIPSYADELFWMSLYLLIPIGLLLMKSKQPRIGSV